MIFRSSLPVATAVEKDPEQVRRIQTLAPGIRVISPERMLEEIQNLPVIAADTETTGLVRPLDQVVFWSLATAAQRYSIPRRYLPMFHEYFTDPDRHQVWHNANFDAWMMLNSGLDLAKAGRKVYRRWDTMVMHTLLADNQPHDLKSLSKKLLNVHMPSFQETFSAPEKDTGVKLREYYLSDPRRVIEYASKDAWCTYQLWLRFKEALAALDTPNGSMLDYYLDVEQRTHEVAWHMEREGVPLDVEACTAKVNHFEDVRAARKADVIRVAGKVFNQNSTKQIQDLLYDWDAEDEVWVDEFGYDAELTKGGESGIRAPSTAAKTLKRLKSEGSPLAAALLEYRSVDTVLKYLKGYLKAAQYDGRVHTTLSQSVARTGRFSSSKPNMQNVKKDDDTFGIRKLFRAPDGFKISDSDFAQVEMRIAAARSGDPTMVSAIRSGKDMHCWTAHLMFNYPYEDFIAAVALKDALTEAKAKGMAVMKLSAYEEELIELRQATKAINFGVIYGETEYKLAEQLKKPVDYAKGLLDAYWLTYPGLRSYMLDGERDVQSRWYAVTALGRRRQIPQAMLASVSKKDYRAGMRAAGNFGIQGEAAELIKLAQIRIFEDDDFWSAGFRQALQIHDEIVGICPEELEYDEYFKRRYIDYKTHPHGARETLPHGIQLKTELKFAQNWGEAK